MGWLYMVTSFMTNATQASVERILNGSDDVGEIDMSGRYQDVLGYVQAAVTVHAKGLAQKCFLVASYCDIWFVLSVWKQFLARLKVVESKVALKGDDFVRAVHCFGVRTWAHLVLRDLVMQKVSEACNALIQESANYPCKTMSDPTVIVNFLQLMADSSLLRENAGSWEFLDSYFTECLERPGLCDKGLSEQLRELKLKLSDHSQSNCSSILSQFSKIARQLSTMLSRISESSASKSPREILEVGEIGDLRCMLQDADPHLAVSLIAVPMIQYTKSYRQEIGQDAISSDSFVKLLNRLEETVLPVLNFVSPLFRAVDSSYEYLSFLFDDKMISIKNMETFFLVHDEKHQKALTPFWAQYLQFVPEYVDVIKRKIADALERGIVTTKEAEDIAVGFLSAQQHSDYFAALKGVTDEKLAADDGISECKTLIPRLFDPGQFRQTIGPLWHYFKVCELNSSMTELFIEYLKTYLFAHPNPDFLMIQRVVEDVTPILFQDMLSSIPRVMRMYHHCAIFRPDEQSVIRVVSHELGSVLHPSSLEFDAKVESWRRNAMNTFPELQEKKIQWCDWNWTFVVQIDGREVVMSGLQYSLLLGNQPDADKNVLSVHQKALLKRKEGAGNIVPLLPNLPSNVDDEIVGTIRSIMEKQRGATYAQIIDLTRKELPSSYISPYKISLALNHLVDLCDLVVDDTIPRMYYFCTAEEEEEEALSS